MQERFEFNLDFSKKLSDDNDHSTIHHNDEAPNDTYRAGYDAGIKFQKEVDQDLALRLIDQIHMRLNETNSFEKNKANQIYNLLLDSLEKILRSIIVDINIKDMIDCDQFGIKSLLESFLEPLELKILISPEDHRAISESELVDRNRLNLLMTPSPEIKLHDFEISWRDGGIIFDHDEVINQLQIGLQNHTNSEPKLPTL